jgi:hypothetical protein
MNPSALPPGDLLPAPPIRKRRRRRQRPAVVAPIPRPFDFGFTAQRPLVPMRAVTMFLNLSPREVLALIEEGKLRWAFDIRTTNATRREIRVLRQSLFEFTGLYSPQAAPRNETEEFLKIINLILPAGVIVPPPVASTPPACPRSFFIKMRLPSASFQKLTFPREPVLRGTEIARCFSCNNQHVHNLLGEKTLQSLNLRGGPKASPLVTRASIIEFLKQRRMS